MSGVSGAGASVAGASDASGAGPVSVAGAPHAASIKARNTRAEMTPCMRASLRFIVLLPFSGLCDNLRRMVKDGAGRCSFPRVARHLLRREGHRHAAHSVCATFGPRHAGLLTTFHASRRSPQPRCRDVELSTTEIGTCESRCSAIGRIPRGSRTGSPCDTGPGGPFLAAGASRRPQAGRPSPECSDRSQTLRTRPHNRGARERSRDAQPFWRALRTASLNRLASSVRGGYRPSAPAFFATRLPPTAMAAAPARMNWAVLSSETPPTGINLTWGSGARTALKYAGPPISAGNTLTKSAPHSQALRISVGVYAPGMTTLS